MRLEPESEHPHGLPDAEFDALFTTDRPVIFAYHGYPTLIHRLTYRRNNHSNLHVRGYKEEGTTTTPFDMVMLNDLDRFHLVIDVIDRVPGLAERAAHVRQHMVDERLRHRAYTREHGTDPPEVTDWRWPAEALNGSRVSTLREPAAPVAGPAGNGAVAAPLSVRTPPAKNWWE
jgi:xylulose-5-phosphate/fructose-6-phosphate phosphoketolase